MRHVFKEIGQDKKYEELDNQIKNLKSKSSLKFLDFIINNQKSKDEII